jgi:thioesterase domain-containing protein
MLHVLRPGQEQIAPVVCIHPVTGRVDAYRALADALAWPGPVLAISAPPPSDGDLAITELATRYATLLDITVPLHVIGWGLGGVIAAELAAEATARGGTVRFVGIVDGRAPTQEMRARPTDRATLAKAFLQHVALARGLAPVAPVTSDATGVFDALRRLGADDGLDTDAVEVRLQTFMALVRAFYRHTPRRVPVAIDLFESTESHPSHPRPPTLGWDELAPAVAHHPVAGDHFTVLAPRHAPALAGAIDACQPA